MKNFTEKDLSYVKDMFEWNTNVLQLTNHFLEEFSDSIDGDSIELLEEIFELHYQNLHQCIRILTGEDSYTLEECEYEVEDGEEEEDEEDE